MEMVEWVLVFCVSGLFLMLMWMGFIQQDNDIECEESINNTIDYYEAKISLLNIRINSSKTDAKYYEDLYYNGCESYKMWNLNLTKDDFGIRGVYYQPEFYCVWLEGNNMSEIKYAENHEIAHHLINEEYKHFCGDDG